jgi:hypothetical protein
MCVAVGSNDLNTFGIALHGTDDHWPRVDDQLPAGVLALNAVACPLKSARRLVSESMPLS